MTAFEELDTRLQAKDWAVLGAAEVAFAGTAWHFDPACAHWDPDAGHTRLFAGAASIQEPLRSPQRCTSAECRRAARDTDRWVVSSHVTYQAFDLLWKLRRVAAGEAGPRCDDLKVVGAGVCNLLDHAVALAKKLTRQGQPLDVRLASELTAALGAARPALEAAARERGIAGAVDHYRDALGLDDTAAAAEHRAWAAITGPELPVVEWYPRDPLLSWLWPAKAQVRHVPYVTFVSHRGHHRLDPAGTSDPAAAVLAALLNDTQVRDAAHAAQLLEVAHAAAGPHRTLR